MKQWIKVLITLLLVGALGGAALLSCGEKSPDDAQQGAATIDLIENGAPKYAIVRSDYFTMADTVTKLTVKMRKALQAVTGMDFSLYTDWEYKDDNAELYEILVGTTNRLESTEAMKTLPGENDYMIHVCENKIVIVGGSDAALEAAVTYFLKTVVGWESEDSFTAATSIVLDAKMVYTGSVEALPDDPVTSGKGAIMVKTKYNTDDVVIANIIATDEPYLADPTGVKDSTSAIQDALYACEDMGGGVVFLPAGEYLVTSTVFVPAGCVLQGDWQDPNTTNEPEYGTVIVAKPKPLSAKEEMVRSSNPLLYMDSYCGMIGLTFYYPEQSATDPVAYGYTIYSEAPRTAVLRNITMINSYRGLGIGTTKATAHELFQNESLRICALDTGIEMHRSTEVGNTVDIDVSPSFWIDAGCGYACDDPDALREYCRENTVGMIVQQLDDECFSSLRFDGCRTALHMPKRDGGQQAIWGMIYDLTVTDCTYGIVAEDLCASIGMVIAKATIDASEKAIVNSSVGGTMKLAGIRLTGDGGIHAEGGDIMYDEDVDLSSYTIGYGSYKKPASYLYNADIAALSGKIKDASPAIQAVLDEAAKTGGVVYLPAGVYSLYSTLRVPEGVQLRGPTPVFVRDGMNAHPDGTVLMTYVTDGAAIELSAHAGVNGLRIFCPAIDPGEALELLESDDALTRTCVGIKGLGEGVYVCNAGVTSTMIGIDFSGCDNHLIKQTFGCTYNTFAVLGGKGGVMTGCLNNPHFINRQSFAALGYCDTKYTDVGAWARYCTQSESGTAETGFTTVRDKVLRTYCTMVEIVDATDQIVSNIFMYAPYELIRVSNSTAALYNTSADFVGFGSVYHVKDNSRVVAVNALRSAGDSLRCDQTSDFDIYNRINTEIYYEGDFHSDDGNEDTFGFEILKKQEIAPENSVSGIGSASLNSDKAYVKEGSYSYKHTAEGTSNTEVLFTYRFNALNISEYMNPNGYLHFRIYMEDMSTQLWGGKIELTSSGGADSQSIYWIPTSFFTHDGWNEVWLPLDDIKGGAGFDPTRVNYFRIVTVHTYFMNQGDVYIDDIYFCNAISDTVRKPIAQTTITDPTVPISPDKAYKPPIDVDAGFLYAHDCESLQYMGASVPLTVNTDPKYIKEGNASLLSRAGTRKNGEEIFLFRYGANALDISDYMERGYLHLWLYVEDIEQFRGGELELTSSGGCDKQEIKWNPVKYIKNTGWNELYLPLWEAQSGSTDAFDPANLNFIRLFMLTTDGTYGNYYIDDVYFCLAAEEEAEGNVAGRVNEKGDLIIATCDAVNEAPLAGTVRLLNDASKVKEGSGTWWVKDNSLVALNLNYTEPLDVSNYMESGYLHLWVWISDASALTTGQIEITSGGDCDKQELNWMITSYVKQDGWNELYLPLASAGSTGGAFNPTAMNYIRIYAFPQTGKTIDYYFDDIRFTNHKN